EDVCSEIQSAVGNACEKSSLHVERRLIQTGLLRCQAKAKPVGGRIGQLVPVVEEVAVGILGIEDEFPFAVERNLFVGQRDEVSGSDASGVAENSSYHRSGVEDELLAKTKVVSEPDRAGLVVFVVVARLDVCPVFIGAKGAGKVRLIIGNQI